MSFAQQHTDAKLLGSWNKDRRIQDNNARSTCNGVYIRTAIAVNENITAC
jgi:hypothetical protein